MELNIISVAFITGFIIIYVVSLITYLILFVLDWRTYNSKLNFLEKAKAFFIRTGRICSCFEHLHIALLFF